MALFLIINSGYSLNSKISPGWQSRVLQMASSVLKRIAFAFPVFRLDRLDNVRFIFSESSFSDIFLLAIITSRFIIIGIRLYLSLKRMFFARLQNRFYYVN